MDCPLKDTDLKSLRDIVGLLKSKPWLINDKNLSFFKDFLEELGAKIPPAREQEKSNVNSPFDVKNEAPEVQEPESEESDLELDMTGVVEPDTDDPQPMGDSSKEPTEEEMEEAQSKRMGAVDAFNEQNYSKAVDIYTEAIILNPQAAMLYAKRGQAYLMMNKPNACIRDCNRALELNPDSAAAHKFRGRAYQLLGNWEEAATDLRLACKFDFDEQADIWLKEVNPNALKIEEHKRKKERKQLEKQAKERQERVRQAREAQAKAREENTNAAQSENTGAPGFGDLPQFLNDPEVIQAFKDPEIMAAFNDISTTPSNILKYQSNPKVMALIKKMADKIGGPAGMAGMMGGRMPGGFPGFPGAGQNPPNDPPKPSNLNDDVGLD